MHIGIELRKGALRQKEWREDIMNRRIPAIIACVTAAAVLAIGCNVSGNAANPQQTASSRSGSSNVADAKMDACMNNLKQLGIACKMFANEHDGNYPAAVEALFPEYTPDQTVFFCPATNSAGAAKGAASFVSDYEIVAGLNDKSPAKTVLIREKGANNHTAAGRNVLHLDGSGAFVAGN